ncbi:alpha/beta hydrolase [Glycomyces luteolus]|uniref:Alpha/beta hydrolase n=1 Tax=Glycomyces luteolus TaxID=2670330 RepID=A0A9X3P772_9ACTN|nr:alpha/beta hydrolase [Glycomyces luteolus]MDA1359527.1 alpha/beta hydrolase [Glycomyces luteolus]
MTENRILLLSVDVDEGRMVIARNNPDNARQVVVMVPGISAGIDSMSTLTQRAEDLFRKLASHHQDDSLSVITWMDYVAPDSPAQARDARYAAPGAARLARMLIELPITAERFGRWRAPARTTVIAHGYGGLVAGIAAKQYGLQADALVLLGCPGAGVASARELRMDGRVYATPSDIDGDGTPAGVHGPRPDAPAFGATVLRPGPLSYQGDPVVRYVPELRRIVFGPT